MCNIVRKWYIKRRGFSGVRVYRERAEKKVPGNSHKNKVTEKENHRKKSQNSNSCKFLRLSKCGVCYFSFKLTYLLTLKAFDLL